MFETFYKFGIGFTVTSVIGFILWLMHWGFMLFFPAMSGVTAGFSVLGFIVALAFIGWFCWGIGSLIYNRYEWFKIRGE